MKFLPFLSALVLAVASVDAAPQDDQYVLGPDSQVKPGVPQGKVETRQWTQSKIYPGTTRDWAVYVPAQYDKAKPANVMVRPLALNTTCCPSLDCPEMRSDRVVPRASAICEATVRCQISS